MSYTFPSTIINFVTYTARRWGQFPIISYVTGGIAGSEVVTLNDNPMSSCSITVKIASGISTNQQIVAAILSSNVTVQSLYARDLVSAVITAGHGTDTNIAVSPTSMTGGSSVPPPTYLASGAALPAIPATAEILQADPHGILSWVTDSPGSDANKTLSNLVDPVAINKNLGDFSAGTITASLTGHASADLAVSSFTDSAVTAKILTGFMSAAGLVGDTDTILEALGKLDGNIAAISPSVSYPLLAPASTRFAPSYGFLDLPDGGGMYYEAAKGVCIGHNSIGTPGSDTEIRLNSTSGNKYMEFYVGGAHSLSDKYLSISSSKGVCSYVGYRLEEISSGDTVNIGYNSSPAPLLEFRHSSGPSMLNLQLTGIQVPDGLSTAPSYSFVNAPTMGMWNALGGQVIIQADTDVYIQADGQNTGLPALDLDNVHDRAYIQTSLGEIRIEGSTSKITLTPDVSAPASGLMREVLSTSVLSIETRISNSWQPIVQVDLSTTAGNTRFLLWDVDKGAMSRVTVGAADSAGIGYKVLRVPN